MTTPLSKLKRDEIGVFQIRAPMPGKVIKLLLAEGAEVQANQGIVVLEAMKMQNERLNHQRKVSCESSV
jgi:biotin carboxyl carrier protein